MQVIFSRDLLHSVGTLVFSLVRRFTPLWGIESNGGLCLPTGAGSIKGRVAYDTNYSRCLFCPAFFLLGKNLSSDSSIIIHTSIPSSTSFLQVCLLLLAQISNCHTVVSFFQWCGVWIDLEDVRGVWHGSSF